LYFGTSLPLGSLSIKVAGNSKSKAISVIDRRGLEVWKILRIPHTMVVKLLTLRTGRRFTPHEHFSASGTQRLPRPHQHRSVQTSQHEQYHQTTEAEETV
jgi:hypothetical protein